MKKRLNVRSVVAVSAAAFLLLCAGLYFFYQFSRSREPLLTQPASQVAEVRYLYHSVGDASGRLSPDTDKAKINKIIKSIGDTKARKAAVTKALKEKAGTATFVIVVRYRNGKADVIESDNAGEQIYRVLDAAPQISETDTGGYTYPDIQSFTAGDHYVAIGGNTELIHMFFNQYGLLQP